MARTPSSWNAWFERRERKSRRKRGEPEPPTKQAKSSTWSALIIPRVIGDRSTFPARPNSSHIRRFARENRRQQTEAEDRLRRVLNALNKGVLKGRFETEHPISGKWIVDVFFPENRLAIEVDGGYHFTSHQMERDRQKDADCQRFDITLLRLTNEEVFGPIDALVAKLRTGWRDANRRENTIIGTVTPLPPGSRRR